MKHPNFKSVLLALVAAMAYGHVMAHPDIKQEYDCEVDGVWYNLDDQTMTAEVTYHDQWNFMDCTYPEDAIEGVDYGVVYKGDVVIPETIEYGGKVYTVTRIGDNAFARSSMMTSVTVPRTVTGIGSYAFVLFARNAALDLTCFAGEPPLADRWSFPENYFDVKNSRLYVPESSVALYRGAEGWKEFGHIIAIEDATGIGAPERGANRPKKVYDAAGHRLPAPRKGLNIVGGRKVVLP